MNKTLRCFLSLVLACSFMPWTEAKADPEAKTFTISGFVREKGSSETLLGVNVFNEITKEGTSTNTYGFYSITLPAGKVKLIFSYVGYQPFVFETELSKDLDMNVFLEPKSELDEVVVEGKKTETVAENPQMSKIEIPVSMVKDIPALLGEKDVLKVIQLMPGVQKGSEGNSGIYVRGGGPDQNLIILDDAIVYNAFHLFGFFSLFNGDAIRSIELTKGGFPARYGGRLSSVLDINMKEGNKEKIRGEAGIGLISSRLTLEGPLFKKKGSFLISGRRTYVDLLTRPFMPEGIKTGYFFYDFTAKLNYELSEKDRLYISSYFGRDKFYLRENFDDNEFGASLNWGNLTGTLRWNHVFNKKTFANASLIYSQYNLGIGAYNKFGNDEFSIRFSSGIRDISAKYDVDYMPNTRHTLRFGGQVISHTFKPRAVQTKNDFLGESAKEEERYLGFESGLYAEDQIRFSTRLRGHLGLRLSTFTSENRTYVRPEPRASFSYMLSRSTSVKASYALMNQYIHLLSNTGIGLPTDLWVPSTPRIGPQQSHQVAAGFAHDLAKPALTFTLEGYYKSSNGVIGYREGASFLGIDDPGSSTTTTWEEIVTTGNAESYGMEFLAQKKVGNFTGWVGYTLSWTTLQFDELNNGRPFYARYDRRHDISVVGVYKISKSITLSGTWVYGTGNAITLPMAEFYAPIHNPRSSGSGGFNNAIFASEYGEKNGFRMSPYHRMDIGIQFHSVKPKTERTFELSFYNLYNRKNPFFYYVGYSNNGNTRKLKQVSLFPIIPSFSYTIKF